MTFKQFLADLASSRTFRVVLPILLAAVFCALLLRKPIDYATREPALILARSGSLLLAGLPDGLMRDELPGGSMAWRMPLFATVFSAAINSGITQAQFLALVSLGICALVFCAGCLLRGYWGGVLSLAAAAFFAASARERCGYNIEQDFYSLFLLLVLSLLLLKRRENTFKINLLAGLAVGASMLARTPLSLFPPALVLGEALYSGGRSRAFIRRSLVFLAASYILLVPWAGLKYSLTGEFSLLDNKSAADNIIAGALGSTYLTGLDTPRLAGQEAADSPFNFYVREAAKDPLSYALTVARRLWHTFLFFPLLFGLFLAALLLNRDRTRLAVFSLPVYFIFIHSLFPITWRYFFPLTYVLPPLIVGSLLPSRFEQARGECGFARNAALSAFWLSLSAVLAVEALIIVYPLRAARNSAGSASFYAALERFPNDRAVQYLKCKERWEKGDDGGFYKCLGAYSEKFDDRTEAYFLSAMASRSPGDPALPAGSAPIKIAMRQYIIKMLREFEAGDRAAAMASFRRAYGEYEMHVNRPGIAPYKKDKEFVRLVKQNSAYFWDYYVYSRLVLWPPEGAAKILSGLEKNIGLTPKLRALKYAVNNIPPSGGPDRRALETNAFAGLVSDILGPRSGSLGLLPGKAGRLRPAAEAYLRAIAAPAAAVSAGSPLRPQGVTEDELLRLLELRDAKGPWQKIAAARSLKRKFGRPVYDAFLALFSLQSGSGGPLRESLDALESELRVPSSPRPFYALN